MQRLFQACDSSESAVAQVPKKVLLEKQSRERIAAERVFCFCKYFETARFTNVPNYMPIDLMNTEYGGKWG
jgi:hypothetical protein